jgi:DNA-binding MarR family transcriptional regulator
MLPPIAMIVNPLTISAVPRTATFEALHYNGPEVPVIRNSAGEDVAIERERTVSSEGVQPSDVWDATAREIVEQYVASVPDADSLAAEANVVMIRAFGVLSDALNDYFAAFQLTHSRYNVLRFLYYSRSPSVKMSEISAGIRRSKTAMTSLVNALERLGLVSRSVKENDKRSVYISLTREGRECVETVLPGYLRRVQDLWSPLDDAEKSALIASLAHLRFSILKNRRASRDGPARQQADVQLEQ